MNDPTAPLPPIDPREPAAAEPNRLRGRLAAVGITGLVIGAAALGLGGVASAGTPAVEGATPAAVTADDVGEPEAEIVDIDDLDEGDWEDAELYDLELSPEDEAVFERFDQCLVDNGLPALDELDDEIEEFLDGEEIDELTEEEWEALEEQWEAEFEAMEETFIAAEEACEPILDELSDEAIADLEAFEEMEFEYCDDLLDDDESYEAEAYDDDYDHEDGEADEAEELTEEGADDA